MTTRVSHVDVMTLDHSIESLTIDFEHTRRCLLVSTRMFEHPGDVSSFNFR